jgi:hypothetical protein
MDLRDGPPRAPCGTLGAGSLDVLISFDALIE